MLGRDPFAFRGVAAYFSGGVLGIAFPGSGGSSALPCSLRPDQKPTRSPIKLYWAKTMMSGVKNQAPSFCGGRPAAYQHLAASHAGA